MVHPCPLRKYRYEQVDKYNSRFPSGIQVCPKNKSHYLKLRVIIPREEQGIKEFDDKEFLTRKTDKENKEFTSIKKGFFKAKIELLEGKNTKI